MKRLELGVLLAVGVVSAAMGASALGAVSGTTHTVTGVSDFQGVACPSSGPCIAVGETPRNSKNESTGVFAQISNGKPGTAHQVSGTSILNRVACPTSTSCIALGEVFASTGQRAVYVQISHGKAGTVHSLGITAGASIGCGTASSCWALGQDFPNHPTGPSSFHAEVVHLVTGQKPKVFSPTPSYNFFYGGAGGAPPACFSATSCILAGNLNYLSGPGAIFSLNNGSVKVMKTVSGTTALSGLDCTSKAFCTIVGNQTSGQTTQSKVTTLSSGKLGTPKTVSNANVFPLTCASASACFAFGIASTQGSAPPNYEVVTISHGAPGSPQQISSFVTGAACQGTACLGVGDEGQFPNQQGTVFTFTG